MKNSKQNRQRIYLKALSVLGLAFLMLSIAPELLNLGKKGFGYTQKFFFRNGVVLFISGMTLLFFPGIIEYIRNKFSDSEYQTERVSDHVNWGSFSRYDFIMLILLLIAANFFAVYIVEKQYYIFNWDSAIYSEKYAFLNTAFKENPIDAVRSVLSSLQLAHYNLFAPFLLLPFSLFFGIERLSFILSMVNIFLPLSAISFLLLYKRTAGKLYCGHLPFGATIIPLFTFFSFTHVWVPLLDGQVGIGGFFIISIILLIYFQYPFPAQRYRTLILLGIMIPILVFFRQYYSFWSASFFIAIIINESIFLLIEYRFDRKRLTVLSKKVFFTIFVSGFFFLMLAAPFLIKIVIGDYSYMTTYKFSSSILHEFKRFLGNQGYIYNALTLSGVFVMFYFRNTRKMASFLVIQWVVMFFLFTRIHSILPHYYNLFLPTILLFISMFITTVLLNFKSGVARIAICSAYILTAALTFSAVFFTGDSLQTSQARVLFPRHRYVPPSRNDIPEIKRMLTVIRELLNDPYDKLYVLAGNETLNSDIISKARLSLPDTPDMGNHIYRGGVLDLKDGFPNNLFKSKYVLIADPIQHDFSPEQTRIIGIPAASLLNGENMGTSYRRLPHEFNLKYDKKKVKVYIFERIGPFNQTDVDFLSDQLREYYPDKPFVYQPNMSDTYTTGR
jgi:hypothetical protein